MDSLTKKQEPSHVMPLLFLHSSVHALSYSFIYSWNNSLLLLFYFSLLPVFFFNTRFSALFPTLFFARICLLFPEEDEQDMLKWLSYLFMTMMITRSVYTYVCIRATLYSLSFYIIMCVCFLTLPNKRASSSSPCASSCI